MRLWLYSKGQTFDKGMLLFKSTSPELLTQPRAQKSLPPAFRVEPAEDAVRNRLLHLQLVSQGLQATLPPLNVLPQLLRKSVSLGVSERGGERGVSGTLGKFGEGVLEGKQARKTGTGKMSSQISGRLVHQSSCWVALKALKRRAINPQMKEVKIPQTPVKPCQTHLNLLHWSIFRPNGEAVFTALTPPHEHGQFPVAWPLLFASANDWRRRGSLPRICSACEARSGASLAPAPTPKPPQATSDDQLAPRFI